MDFSAKLLSIVLHPLLMPLYTVLLALELDPHLGYFLQAERRWLTVGMLALMMWTASRRQKKERAERENLMNSLRKGDTVLTIGGIKGVIAENPDGKDEIILTVDETTRNRIRFVKTAITQVVRGDSVIDVKSDRQGSTAKAGGAAVTADALD